MTKLKIWPKKWLRPFKFSQEVKFYQNSHIFTGGRNFIRTATFLQVEEISSEQPHFHRWKKFHQNSHVFTGGGRKFPYLPGRRINRNFSELVKFPRRDISPEHLFTRTPTSGCFRILEVIPNLASKLKIWPKSGYVPLKEN